MLGKVFGVSYLLGRLVSAGSFAALLALLFRTVQMETRAHPLGTLWGIVALGMVAMAFSFTEGWYDLVRNDSLYLALIMGSLYLLRFHDRSTGAVVCAGVLASLSFLTKQVAAFFIVYNGAVLLLSNRRRLPVYVGTIGVVAGGAVVALNISSDGWYWKYVFEFIGSHQVLWSRFYAEALEKLWTDAPLTLVMLVGWPLVMLTGLVVRRQLWAIDHGLLFWQSTALVAVFVGGLGYAKQWAVSNALIPAYVFPSLFAALAVAKLAHWITRRSPGRALVASVLFVALCGMLLGNFLEHWYSPQRFLPSPEDRLRGQALVELIGRYDGPVLVPQHPWYAKLAGKEPGYHDMTISDLEGAGVPFPADIKLRVARREYDAILFDINPRGRNSFLLNDYVVERTFTPEEVPQVVTGFRIAPALLLVPRR